MRARESGQSALLLLDVIDILKERKVPYAVIGAMAVAFYGVVRSSLDADAIIRVGKDQKEVDRLRTALTKKGWNVVIKKGGFDDPLVGVVLIEDALRNRVDLLLGLKKGDPGLFQRTRPVKFEGETIHMVGPEDLIAMKVFAGSAKDMADAEGILAVSGEMVDRKELARLAGHFGEPTARRLKEIV